MSDFLKLIDARDLCSQERNVRDRGTEITQSGKAQRIESAPLLLQ